LSGLDPARQYAQSIVLTHPALQGVQDRVGVVLSGSRAVGYHVPSSDYDYLALCERETYLRVARQVGASPDATSIDLVGGREPFRLEQGIEVEGALFEETRVRQALDRYVDVPRWIWAHARSLHDPAGVIQRVQASIAAYPREVLKRKLIQHFMADFDLSVHGITYRYESQNVFSVVHALGAKVAEYCRICCLLDGRPFPYDKWLLRACKETTTGACLAPHLERALDHVTHLGSDLVQSAERVRQAVYALDTEACDILEEAMVDWGIEREWIENSYQCLSDVLLDAL
jgi:hypothetical protein